MAPTPTTRSISPGRLTCCVGVVPIINLEWIQKLHRDQKMRGYSQEAVTDTILRRMPDYVSHLCPQFSRTHVNFQRVPIVDTSNPFIARDIPTADESMVVIRFANPKGIDFQYLLNILHGAMLTRPNTLVVPGGKMGLAMQMIFTPMVLRSDGPEASRLIPNKERDMSQVLCATTPAVPWPTPSASWPSTPSRPPNPATPAPPWAWPTSPKCCGTTTSSTTRPTRKWADRDRFVLSNGHGSMLLYACCT
jgi:hypothetical protein